MAKLIILEGTRATGKSTISHKLRQNIEGSTLINFTGFKEDGNEGLKKVSNYYDGWLKVFEYFDDRYTFICDRLFMSEWVYSNLYKEYSFESKFTELLNKLLNQNHQILLYILSVNKEDIESRINREKVSLFNSISDTILTIEEQKDGYEKLNKKITEEFNLKSSLINTSERTIESIYEQIISDSKN